MSNLGFDLVSGKHDMVDVQMVRLEEKECLMIPIKFKIWEVSSLQVVKSGMAYGGKHYPSVLCEISSGLPQRTGMYITGSRSVRKYLMKNWVDYPVVQGLIVSYTAEGTPIVEVTSENILKQKGIATNV
jgi:hypothetical protein